MIFKSKCIILKGKTINTGGFMSSFLERLICIWQKIDSHYHNTRNNISRKNRLKRYRTRRKTIVVSNRTNSKFFLERKDGDFSAKKAVKIHPGKTMTVVVSFYKGNVIFLRDIKERLLEISKPVFQIEIVPGEKPGSYVFNDFV